MTEVQLYTDGKIASAGCNTTHAVEGAHGSALAFALASDAKVEY